MLISNRLKGVCTKTTDISKFTHTDDLPNLSNMMKLLEAQPVIKL